MFAKFPDVAVIWAHGGYTPLFLARRMLEAHPNLYYELSARTWAVHPRSPEYTILKAGTSVWAQWLELINDPEQKISRPRQLYVGAPERDYVALGARK